MVVCTGSSYAFPAKVAEVDATSVPAKYSKMRQDVNAAENITVIGGGAVGLELVGELSHYYSKKNITLIHTGETVLNNTALGDKMKAKTLAAVQALPNVKVMLGERVEFSELQSEIKESSVSYVEGKRELTTSKGNKVGTDLVFFCTGTKTNTKSFKDNLPVDEEGRIKVNEHLQIEGCKTAFALGDCAAIGPKFAYLAMKFQAPVINKNIRALEKKKGMSAYKKGPTMMVLPLGPNGGNSQLPMGIVVGNFLTRTIKSGDLFSSNTWGELNQDIANV
mmetsp:Transcript_28182/g.47770  ORF Transcript_28182/g.47770 Transcript_28182/m.47770 type:complete len:278 (-) Transcript_28182:692-1525(-)